MQSLVKLYNQLPSTSQSSFLVLQTLFEFAEKNQELQVIGKLIPQIKRDAETLGPLGFDIFVFLSNLLKSSR
jgi:hypothetical protein